MSENKTAKTPTDGPVAWGCQCGRAYTVTCISSKPSKREWVGLMDEEFMAIAQKYSLPTRVGLEYFKDELEAKLKEKNHG